MATQKEVKQKRLKTPKVQIPSENIEKEFKPRFRIKSDNKNEKSDQEKKIFDFDRSSFISRRAQSLHS